MAEATEQIDDIRKVARALTGLAIPYALGGSMASSLLGVPRFTRDADLTVEPFPGREQALVACFERGYYLSAVAIAQANRLRCSFNIINTHTGFKVDLFVRKDRPFELSAMRRRTIVELADDPSQPLAILTAEDVILYKLEWFRLGGETSGQQWSDVLGVLRVQAGRLDQAYLNRWASDLQVGDLLARAMTEAAR